MILQLFRKSKELTFERTYAASPDVVWRAWTDAERLRRWWGPPKTTIDECEVDAVVGGRIRVVMVAGPEMGKYAGTRWPMEGAFTAVEPHTRLAWEARSWTEGDDDTVIEHVNELTLAADGQGTRLDLQVTITDVGPGAKMAAFGMKMGYRAQLGKLADLLGE